MIRVKEVRALEAYNISDLETYINDFIEKSGYNKSVVDIKYSVYKTDISPEFLDLETDGKTEETRHVALILLGEET